MQVQRFFWTWSKSKSQAQHQVQHMVLNRRAGAGQGRAGRARRGGQVHKKLNFRGPFTVRQGWVCRKHRESNSIAFPVDATECGASGRGERRDKRRGSCAQKSIWRERRKGARELARGAMGKGKFTPARSARFPMMGLGNFEEDVLLALMKYGAAYVERSG